MVVNEWTERGPHYFDAIALIGEDGTLLENYRKTHLYGDSERLVWDFGRSDFPAVMVNGFPIRGDGKNLQ